jgi:hypothetical protein
MRAFRNRLGAAALFLATLGGVGVVGAVPSGQGADGNAMYPLAVGNSWTYRCTVEGAPALTKTTVLKALLEHNGVRYFQAEMRVTGDPKPLVYFLATNKAAEVFKVSKPDDAAAEILMSSAPKNGEKVGGRFAVLGEKMRVPALGQVAVVRAENFPQDDPKVSADQRMEWTARYYAVGIGLVAEADGLGGQCVLTRYKLAKTSSP